ncbi:hypothetical protein [Streptacidiphilus monticola]|uniref:Uncharacterized protein n=1 Tax=Streptacidiphilus monticola TaxID=2161674 RepID=A0ABW1G996_9ACTN
MIREPTYQVGDIIETRDGRQLEVLSVGAEAYVLRPLGGDGAGGSEGVPWDIAECEDATWLVEEGRRG